MIIHKLFEGFAYVNCYWNRFFFFYSPNKLAAPFIDEEVFRIYTRFQEDDVEKWHSNQMDHMVKSFKDLSFRREDLLIGLLRRYLGN